MKYKLIGDNDINNIIESTLRNRGVDNGKKYLNLNTINDKEYEDLDHIHEAVELFASHIERGSDVGILFDTDT